MSEDAEKCKHELLELVEEDGDVVWMRCYKCHVLFKFARQEFEQMEEVKQP